MRLTSPTLLYLLFAGAVAVPVALLAVWDKVRGPRSLQVAQRLAGVVLAQVLLTLAVLALVNDVNDLFPAWSDLFPQHGGPALRAAALDPSAAGNGYRASADVRAAQTQAAAAGTGRFAFPPPAGYVRYNGSALRTTLHGATSGVTAPVLVWLPPQYFAPAYAHARFPVLELFNGFPGSPRTWLGPERVISAQAAAVQQGGHPFVLVMPTINVAHRSDLECSNLAGYPAAETFLATDVPNAIAATFRTLHGPRAWGAMGISEGGFCALKMATFHTATFGAAASLAGYGDPSSPLFGPDAALRAANSPNVRLATQPPSVDLLLATSKQDRTDYSAYLRTVAAVRPPTRVSSIVTAKGGHRHSVWAKLVTPAFVWFSQHLEAPAPLSTHAVPVRRPEVRHAAPAATSAATRPIARH